MVDPVINLKVKSDTSDVRKDLKKTDKEVDKTRKSVKGLQSDMAEVKFLAVAGFAAIAAGAAVSVKAFAQFDNELRGVKTLLNENSFGAKGLEKGFADMTDQVKALGKRVPVDLGAMNKALFDTVSAGVSAGDAVKVLETSARLATAGLTDVSTATDGMTSALNAYQLGAEDAELVASKFFTAQKFGKTTIAELSASFGVVGASAAAFGVSLDELLAATSAATAGGISTSAAFIGLKAILTNITKPTERAAEEAERLKIAFDTTTLKSEGFKKFLDNITTSAGFNSQSIEKLFGSSQALNTALALTGGQAAKFAETLDALTDKQGSLNTLNDAYTTSVNSLQNQLKLAENQTKLLSIAVGEALAPQVLLVTKYWTNLINEIASGKTNIALNAIIAVSKAMPGLGVFSGILEDLRKSGDAPEKATKNLKELSEEITGLEEKLSELKEEGGVFQGIMDAESIGDSGELEDALNERFQKIADFEAELAILEQEKIERIAEEKAAEVEKERLHQEKLKKIKTDAALQDKKDDAKFLKEWNTGRAKQLKKEEKEAKAKLVFDQMIGQQRVALAGNISGLVTAVLGNESKAAFLISKAAALAQVIISNQLASARALATTGGNPLLFGPIKSFIDINSGVQAATIAASAITGFNDGGFVGGNTPTGDRQVIRANTGEAVLTNAQQREFMALANGGGGGSKEIVLTLKDNLIDFIEAEVIERRSLGEATI